MKVIKRRLARGTSVVVSAIGVGLPVLVRDLAALAGVGLISYGAWLAYPPAGFAIGGVLLLAGALLATRAD